MFYLIFCGILFAIEVLGFEFYWCSLIVVVHRYRYDFDEHFILFYYYDAPIAIPFCLITTVLAIVFSIILFSHVAKTYSGSKEKSAFPFVFSLILTVILIVQLVSFSKFMNVANYLNYTYNDSYWYTTKLCKLTLVLYIVAPLLASLMSVIAGVFAFSKNTQKNSFFNLSNPNTIEKNLDAFSNNNQTDYISTNDNNIVLLTKYGKLAEQGILTKEEFNKIKSELL